jgi:hypothetical protein|nr:MAG TPA: hypothetical protein [Caudoviricetes sp.]
MKRYKLLKELPTFDAGDEFYLDSNNSLRLKGSDIMAYNHKTLEKFPNILTDWFEEIPEFERWRAAYGETYVYISDDGSIAFDTENGDNIDRYRHNTGNYAKTDELELLSRKQEYLRARQVLLDDAEGGKFSYGEENWCPCYCKTFHKWVSVGGSTYYPGTIYFKTREALGESLKEHRDQWETVRKYEMGEK